MRISDRKLPSTREEIKKRALLEIDTLRAEIESGKVTALAIIAASPAGDQSIGTISGSDIERHALMAGVLKLLLYLGNRQEFEEREQSGPLDEN